jgi:hypothetical protein
LSDAVAMLFGIALGVVVLLAIVVAASALIDRSVD